MKSAQMLLLATSLLFANETVDVTLPNSTGEILFGFSTSEIKFSNGSIIQFSKFDQTPNTNGGSGEFVFSFIDSISEIHYKIRDVDTTLFFVYDGDNSVDTLGIYPTHPVAYYNHQALKNYTMSAEYEKTFYIDVDGHNSLRCTISDNQQAPYFGTLSWETDSLGNKLFASEDVAISNISSVPSHHFTVINNKVSFESMEPYAIKIFSADGRQLREVSGSGNAVSLNSFDLANGVYQMQIVQGTQMFSRQFILR